MIAENSIFKKHNFDFRKLVKFGFEKSKVGYRFEQLFYNNQFKLIIFIDNKKQIQTTVFDNDTNEEFLPLKIDSAKGTFIGDVKNEYEQILINIREKCCSKNYFIYSQTNRVTDYIINKYSDKPEFLWEKYDYGVFRNADSNKWYALIGSLELSKLDKTKSGEVEIINLKLDEKKISELHKQKGYYPAWHMNKKSWITLVLDGTLSDEEVYKCIDESYSYTIIPNRHWIVPANPNFFDLESAFQANNEIIWKQSSKIKKGDIAYMYVASPFSAILYKCEVTDVNIPYNYEDENLKINKVMKIKLLKKYNNTFMTFKKMKKYGINAVRGPRICPEKLIEVLN